MDDPRIDQLINMLNTIGAEMGIEFPAEEDAGVPPEMGMEEEMLMPNPEKEKYLKMKPEGRAMADKKQVFGKKQSRKERYWLGKYNTYSYLK